VKPSAKVKALADWVVTSSIAVDVIKHLDAQNKKILWAPDKHLGQYIQKQTGADMLLWQGHCIVPESIVELADYVGSTSQLIRAAKTTSQSQVIVATEKGIFHKMQQAAPDKELIIAPTAGEGATCRSCAHCPWMKMNQLENMATVFEQENNEVFVDAKLIERALIPLERMVNFKSSS